MVSPEEQTDFRAPKRNVIAGGVSGRPDGLGYHTGLGHQIRESQPYAWHVYELSFPETLPGASIDLPISVLEHGDGANLEVIWQVAGASQSTRLWAASILSLLNRPGFRGGSNL
jgi:hypothetical protein